MPLLLELFFKNEFYLIEKSFFLMIGIFRFLFESIRANFNKFFLIFSNLVFKEYIDKNLLKLISESISYLFRKNKNQNY